MKNLLPFLALLLLPVAGFGQTFAANVLAAADIISPATETTGEDNLEYTTSAQETDRATAQLRAYLATHLIYPTEMTELALTGEVTALVILSPRGEIVRVSIIDTNLPETFGREVTRTLSGMKSLGQPGAYRGYGALYLPVSFSL